MSPLRAAAEPPLMQAPSTSWRDRLAARADRWMTSPSLHRWASKSLLTRWLVRGRSAQLFGLMSGFVHTQVLLACVRLRVLDHVLESPRTIDELARLTRVPAASMQRLLDSAVALRLLERRGQARYGLGSLGAPVLAHAGIRAMVEHNAVLFDDLRDPLALLRQPSQAHMHRYWPYTEDSDLPAPKEQCARYSALMASSQRFVIDELLASYPFQDHRMVLDVGGGMGGWVSALAQQHPGLQLQLFDLPAVAALASEQVQRQGLSKRIAVHGGSFTQDALPTGADLVTLVRVAHDHADSTVRTVLRAIFDALPLGGALLLAEPMAEAGGTLQASDPYFHFYLLAMGAGRLRTPEQLMALMQEAGFSHIERVPNRQPLHTQILLARKAKCLPGIDAESVNTD